MKWGTPDSRAYISLLEQSKRPLPEEYLQRPGIDPGLMFYLEAFWDLSTDRQITMGGEGHIPFSAIDRFGRRADLQGEAFSRFKALVRAMDREYLGHRSAARERIKKQAEAEAEDRDVGAERVKHVKRKLAKKHGGG